jgi:MRG-binding protein
MCCLCAIRVLPRTSDVQEPEGYDPSGDPSSPHQVDSPLPTDNLASHPFFRYEFNLPADDYLETEISRRRMRNSPSLPSSPVATPPPKRSKIGGVTKGKGKKASLAGLVGGDSDSSALTQESGEEDDASVAPTVTGTDVGTEDPEDEEDDAEGESPG